MKTHIIALVAFIILLSQSVRSATPEEQARFLAAVRQAYDKHDTNAVFELVFWSGVSDKDADGLKKMLVREITETKVSSMRLVDHAGEWKDKDGKVLHMNRPVTKILEIQFSMGSWIGSDSSPVGEKDGKLYLLGPLSVN